MSRNLLVVAGFGLAACAGTASADFIGASIENLGDLGAGVNTYRVFMDFDSPDDTVLAINGDDTIASLRFLSLDGDPLRNTEGAFSGTSFEDLPFPGVEAWDSWVTLGTDAPGASDAQFSPDFLGGTGSNSVIAGTSFTQVTNGGYFDSNPGTPENGGSVLVAQFTVANFSYEGTVSWQAAGAGVSQDAFFVSTAVPAPGALALLGLAGVAARRRRRG